MLVQKMYTILWQYVPSKRGPYLHEFVRRNIPKLQQNTDAVFRRIYEFKAEFF